jgi:hypothetical protein
VSALGRRGFLGRVAAGFTAALTLRPKAAAAAAPAPVAAQTPRTVVTNAWIAKEVLGRLREALPPGTSVSEEGPWTESYYVDMAFDRTAGIDTIRSRYVAPAAETLIAKIRYSGVSVFRSHWSLVGDSTWTEARCPQFAVVVAQQYGIESGREVIRVAIMGRRS